MICSKCKKEIEYLEPLYYDPRIRKSWHYDCYELKKHIKLIKNYMYEQNKKCIEVYVENLPPNVAYSRKSDYCYHTTLCKVNFNDSELINVSIQKLEKPTCKECKKVLKNLKIKEE